jgi:hypothetical protein
MTSPPRYVLDANVFIEAHKRYYAFDICPGYWAALIAQHHSGLVCSIDRVRDELLAQTDALTDWAKKLPASFFARTGDPAVTGAFGSIMTWVQNQAQYLPAAKSAFAGIADGWLVAYAKAQGLIIATEEVRDPMIKKKVPIPNVGDAFGVTCINTFDMLRALGVAFN